MAREVAEAEARRFGRAAGLLSIGIGSAGLLTYVYFSLASHNLGKVAYGELVVLWSAVFVTISTLFRPGGATALADDRRAPGGRAADRPAAAGRSDDPARPGRRLRHLRPRPPGPAPGRPPVGQRDPVLDHGRPPRSPSARASSRAAFWPALGASPSTPCCCSPSPRPGSRLRSRSPSASPAAKPRSPWGSSPPRAEPHGRSARLRRPRGGQEPRGAAPAPPASASSQPEFTLAAGGGFAAAVLLIMVSEQTLLNAGPLVVKATEGAAAAGFIFNVLMIARAPLVLFQAVATSLLPHLTRLRSSADARRRGGLPALGSADDRRDLRLRGHGRAGRR